MWNRKVGCLWVWKTRKDKSVILGEGQYKLTGTHWKLTKLHLKVDFPSQSLSRCCSDISLLVSEQRSPEYMVKSHTTANIN